MLNIFRGISPLFLLACFLCALPIFLTTYPPMVDLPQHAGQINFLSLWNKPEFKYQHLLELNIFRPYWLGYGLVMLFSQFLSITTSIKIIVAITVVLFPVSFALFRRETNIPSFYDWTFLTLSFGFAYDWGFFNFLIGGILALWFLRDTIRYKQNLISPWKIVFWVNILFFAHVLIMLFFSAISFFILISRENNIRHFVMKTLPLFSSIPITAYWFFTNVNVGATVSGPWDLGIFRLIQFIPNMISLPSTTHFFVIGLFLMLTPIMLGHKISRDPAKLLPFIFYTLWMLLAPNYLFGNYFTYNRFGMFGLPLYLFMFDYNSSFYNAKIAKIVTQNIKFFRFFLFIISILFITRITLNSLVYEKESEGFHDVLKQMNPNKKVLSLIFNNKSSINNNRKNANQAPIFLHYSSWYQAEKSGLVDFNFASFKGMTIHYKIKMQPSAGRGFEWTPHLLDWKKHNVEQYDYIIVKSKLNIQPYLLSKNENIALIINSGDWWLFEQNRYIH